MNWSGDGREWPPTEKSAYEYLVECAGPKSPPSRAQRFLESMGFIYGTFGFPVQAILESKRLEGFAAEQSKRLGIRKPSAVIPFWIIRALEFKLVESEATNDEAVIIGAMLMLLSLRARFSDINCCERFERVGNRITLTVTKTKTSARSKERLPVTLVGPVCLTTGGDWVREFLKRREDLGIPFPATPLFPSKEGERWTGTSGRLQDFNAAMRMILTEMSDRKGGVATSHGLKAT
eukprot:965809-Karenia_brevis.AAC.1